MQLDVSEPLREAVRLRREANASAGDAYVLARKALSTATLDKSFECYAERDLQMIQQDLNRSDDYTIEDMSSVRQRAAELVDAISAETQKNMRGLERRLEQSTAQPQAAKQPSRGPRL